MLFYLIAFVVVCLLACFDICFVAVFVYFVRGKKELEGKEVERSGRSWDRERNMVKIYCKEKNDNKKITPAPENCQLCFSDCK